MDNEIKTDVRSEIEPTEGNITVKKNKTLDFLAKIICLLLAFFLWYYAVSVDTVIQEEEFAAIPVEIVNRSSFAVLSGAGMTVDVTLSGSRNELRKIKNSNIRAYVDVSNVTEAGEKYFDIQITLPSGVSVTLEKKSVETVTVYLDNKVSKTIPTEAKLENYSMSSEHTLNLSEMSDIVITGPEQIVNRIIRAELPVDFNNAEITSGRIFKGKLRLICEGDVEISEADRRYVRLSKETAEVTVSLYGRASVPVNVTFKHGIQKLENCTVTLSRKTINVYGEIGVIENLTVNCVIDEKTLKSGTSVNCGIGLHSGVQNLDPITSLKVTVNLKNYTEKKLSVPVYDPNGTIITTVSATFRGESDIMADLSAANIKASAKPADGATGVLNAPVIFEFLGEFSGKVYEIYKEGSPYTVRWTVEEPTE